MRQREDAIAQRAQDLAEADVRTEGPWAQAFGPPPTRPVVAEAWWDRLGVLDAYRDRWGVTTSSVLGDGADLGSLAQVAHRNRAHQAAEEVARLAGFVSQTATGAPSGPGVGAQAAVEV